MRSVNLVIAGTLALTSCAVAPPVGPNVMALPPQGKGYEMFAQDDIICRQAAAAQTGGESPAQAGTNAAVGSAVVGTAVGAGLGMALGSLSGAMGAGAAVGAATGLLVGSAVGAGNAQAAAGNLQQRYDTVYTQCMYARGNTVQSPPVAYAANPYGPGYAPGYYAPGYSGYYGPVYGGSVVIGTGWGAYPRGRWHRGGW
jgi:hypothetical protein